MGLVENLAFGFGIALSPVNLAYAFLGVTVGTFIGVLPGIGALATIGMLLPVTFGLSPVTALIMLAGIYYGALYGGSTAAILVNLPGTPANAVVCLDGYPMAQQGRAAPALVMTTVASFIGGSIAILVVASFAPPLARAVLRFGAAEYFSMMVLGLLAAVVITRGSVLKGIAMVCLGLVLGLVGIDVTTGVARFTFGIPHLLDGIGFVVLAMGLFGFSEMIVNLESAERRSVVPVAIRWRQLMPSGGDMRASAWPMLRGTVLGSLLGPVPGVGPTISSFVSYSVEKKLARHPERFGQGAIEGVSGPEAANNAAAQTGFIPTLTLGIPGDAVMALMLGALMIHGIAPGPHVMRENPDLFWGLIASMWIGNLFLLVLNLPLVGVWVALLRIPYQILFPSVLVFISIGVYSLNTSPLDVFLAAGFGLLGYVFVKLGCEPAPLLLGFILGPMMEENLRRALLISRGDPTVFVTRPLSLLFLLVALALVLLVTLGPVIRHLVAERRAGRRVG
jgi:putative tricarboxylic transport membrane protein